MPGQESPNFGDKADKIVGLFQLENQRPPTEIMDAAIEIRKLLEIDDLNRVLTEDQLNRVIKIACEGTPFEGAPIVKLLDFQYRVGVDGVLIDTTIGLCNSETIGSYTIIFIYSLVVPGTPIIIYKPKDNRPVYRQ